MSETGREATQLNEQMTAAIKTIEQAQQKLNIVILSTPTSQLRNDLTDVAVLQELAITKLR